MGILIPCVAKHLLRGVLSQTPGNFFAEYTWNTSLKDAARIGAAAWFTIEPFAETWLGGLATLTNEKRSLHECVSDAIDQGNTLECLPKVTLGPHAQILHDEPDADLIIHIN